MKVVRWMGKVPFLYILLFSPHLLLGKFSRKKPILVLSLGKEGAAHNVCAAVTSLGYKAVLVCPIPTFLEMKTCSDWVRLHPLHNEKKIRTFTKRIAPLAVVVESKNLLLPLQEKLAKQQNLVGVSDLAATTSCDKKKFREALEKAGIVQVGWDTTAPPSFPCVIKPCSGTQSKGVSLVQDGEGVEKAVLFAKQASTGDAKVLFEEYVEGAQFDVEGVAFQGQVQTLCIVQESYGEGKKTFGPNFFLFNPELDLEQEVIAAAEKVVKAAGVREGAWHCELRLKNGVPVPLDYANRMGYPDLVTLATGIPIVKKYVQTMLGISPFPFTPKKRAVIARYVREEKELESWGVFKKKFPQFVKKYKTAPFSFSTDKYLGYVLLSAPSYGVLREALKNEGLDGFFPLKNNNL